MGSVCKTCGTYHPAVGDRVTVHDTGMHESFAGAKGTVVALGDGQAVIELDEGNAATGPLPGLWVYTSVLRPAGGGE